MTKFFTIEDNQLPYIVQLMKRQVDQEYVILRCSNGYADICQYSGKYQNVHLVTVPENRLDDGLRLF